MMAAAPAGWGKWILLGLALAGVAWGQSREESWRLFDEQYLPQVQQLLQRGEYQSAELMAGEAMNRGAAAAAWRMLYLRALGAQGRLRKATDKLPGWLEQQGEDVRFLEAAAAALMELGDQAGAQAVWGQLNAAAAGKPLIQRTADELVALGRAASAMGAAPDLVLQRYFERAKKLEPASAAAFQAAGELALAKWDYERAAKEFRAGLKLDPEDAELRYGLAQALWPGSREEALREVEKALGRNPRHVGALLMRAEHAVDQEEYEEAEGQLALVNKIFPGHPVGRTLAAAIASLRDGDDERREVLLAEALAYRERNPEVPHVLGRCLSRKYRMEEGERYQRMALSWDPNHGRAKLALTADLLKLGREDEAWVLAEAAARADPYNVLAYNYGKLRRQLAGYQTRETAHFRLRMRPDEMAVYGNRVLALLEEARSVLGGKYEGAAPAGKTLVEIFAEQQDFAIRTFGELGGAGYLGVCFGTVVTLNSPAAAGATALNNWEATLWHEYCHVVTLTATRNRMPRWLSEGISVYEERERSPVWGARMNAEFRARLLGDTDHAEPGLVPIKDLSRLFLRAEKPQDVMFAYYESSLVVEYLFRKQGAAKVRNLMSALARGTGIGAALAKSTEGWERLEADFAAYARAKAEDYGKGVDWVEPAAEMVSPLDRGAVKEYAAERPNNLWARRRLAEMDLAEGRWQDALTSARELIVLFPEDVGEGNGYALLGRAARELNDPKLEAWAWEELAKRKADAVDAYGRLADLAQARGDWAGVAIHAERLLAVNPLSKRAQWSRGRAAEEMGQAAAAAESFGALLRLGPENPAEVHFRLARVIRAQDPARARREAVEALLEAPRFAEAHELLAELVK